MTFSHHHILITRCHEGPPPLLPYHAALMSGHVIKHRLEDHHFQRLQMPCSEHRSAEWSQIGCDTNSDYFAVVLVPHYSHVLEGSRVQGGLR